MSNDADPCWRFGARIQSLRAYEKVLLSANYSYTRAARALQSLTTISYLSARIPQARRRLHAACVLSAGDEMRRDGGFEREMMRTSWNAGRPRPEAMQIQSVRLGAASSTRATLSETAAAAANTSSYSYSYAPYASSSASAEKIVKKAARHTQLLTLRSAKMSLTSAHGCALDNLLLAIHKCVQLGAASLVATQRPERVSTARRTITHRWPLLRVIEGFKYPLRSQRWHKIDCSCLQEAINKVNFRSWISTLHKRSAFSVRIHKCNASYLTYSCSTQTL